MARPRSFDEDRAIDAAMRAFWAHGYQATSTQDLCRATGLNPSSFYNTFHGKRELFLRALRRYLEEMSAVQAEVLEARAPVRQKVATVLEQVIDDEAGDRLGCFAINTSLELAPRDPEIAGLLARDYDRRMAVFRTVFALARAEGQIPADRDPGELAHFVNATVAGIRVVAQSGADRTALEAIARSALRLF
ncbi:TetR/AcrR family transcriptional regulator [Spirillospora sp. NPDC052269]